MKTISDEEYKHYELLKTAFTHLKPDLNPNTFFICGGSIKVDKNGLPDHINVCPAYGVDWSVIYKRVE